MIILTKKDIFAIGILFLVIYYFWNYILSLQFQGEGFYYFTDRIPDYFSLNLSWSFPYDYLALQLFSIFLSSFKEQTELYMAFEFIIMLTIAIAYYLLSKAITKSTYSALFISLFFGTSYIGNYDMFSSGGYQYFVQRGIILLPLLVSFNFYYLAFSKKSLLFYIFSFILYTFSVAMGFYATWFLPVFIFYPLFLISRKNTKFKNIFIAISSTPFILINKSLIQQSVYYNDGLPALFSFIYHDLGFAYYGVLHQLVTITIPNIEYIHGSLVYFGHVYYNLFHSSLLNTIVTSLYHDNFDFIILSLLVIILYLTAFIFILLKPLYKPYRPILLTAFFSLLSMLLFNDFLNASNVHKNLGSSRYFYFPYAVFALFWGIFFACLLKHHSKYLKIFSVLFLLVLMIVNYNLINIKTQVDSYRHISNKVTIDYLELWKPEISKNTSYIWLPSSFGAYGAEYAKRFYISSDSHIYVEGFVEIDYPGLAQKKVNPKRVYALHYDPKEEKVVNITQEVRQKLKNLYSAQHEREF